MRGLPTARPRGGRFSHPLPRFPDRAASSHPQPGCGARLPTCAAASLCGRASHSRPPFAFLAPCAHANAQVPTRSRKQDVASEQARRHASARHPASTRRILPHPTSNNRTQRIPKRHARRARRASCALRARCGACLRYHGCDQRERTNHAARNAPTEEHRAGFRRMDQ